MLANFTLQVEKLDSLEQAREEKLTRLQGSGLNQGANLEESYSMLNGNMDSNRNKIHNDFNSAELQYLLGYANNKYGSDIQDATENRRLYLYDTKTGDSKAGVSTGGADTSDVRYDNTLDPRYKQDWRTSGESGPDLNKKRLDLNMDYGAATAMEALWHGNSGNLTERKYPNVLTDEAIKAGSGVSEYYKGNGLNFLGDSSYINLSPERVKQLEKQFDNYVTTINAQKDAANYDRAPSLDRLYADAGGEISRTGESIDLMKSQALKMYADLSDTARSGLRSLLGNVGVREESLNKYLPTNAELLGTGQKVQSIRNSTELRDKMAGFDTRDAWNEEKAKFQKEVGDDKYASAAWNVVTNFDRYLAESAPEMAVMMVPYAGIPAVAASRLNNQMEEFEKTNKRSMTTEEAIHSLTTIVPLLYAEKVLFKTGATHAIDNIAKGNFGKAGAGVLTSSTGEAVQEAGENTQEQWSIGKAEDRDSLTKLGEYATSDETIGGAIAGGVMGGGLRAGAETGALALNQMDGKVLDGVKSKLSDKLQARADRIRAEQEVQAKNQEYTKPYTDKFQSIKDTGDKDLVTSINDLIYLSQDLDVEGNTKLREEVESYKNTLVEKLASQVADEKSFKFGSSEEALRVLKEIYYSSSDKLNETLNSNLETIANKYNLQSELNKLKTRDQVEEDVTVSDKGYTTYENKINSLLQDPENNSDQLTKYVNKLEYFKSTQETKLAKLENILKQAEVQFENTDNSVLKFPEYQVRVNKLTGKGQALELNRSDYENFKQGNPTGYWSIINDTKNTISNIDKILSKPELNSIIEPDTQIDATIPEYPVETTKYGTFDATKEYSVKELEPLITAMYPDDGSKPYKPKASNKALEQFMINNSKVIDEIQKKRMSNSNKKSEVKIPVSQEVNRINNEVIKLNKQIKQSSKDTDTTNLEIQIQELESKLETYLDSVEINDILDKSGSNGVTIEPSKKLNIEVSYDSSINKILTKSKPTMLSSISVSAFSDSINNYTKSIVNKLSKLLPSVDNTKSKYGNMTEEQIRLRQSPARGLIFDKNGNINNTVALAIGSSIEDLIKNSGSLLKLKNRDEVMRMLDKVYISQEEYNFFKNKGMFLKVVADDLANNIIKHLGVKLNKDIPEELQAKFKADLGNIAIHLAQELGYIKIDQVSLKEFATKLGKENEYSVFKDDINDNAEVKVSFVSIGSKEATMFDTLNQELNIESDYNRYPSSTPIKNSKYAKQVRNNPYNTINQKVKDALQAQRNTKYITRPKSIEWLNTHRDIALKWLGYKSQEEINNLSKVDQDTAVAKNESIIRSIDALKNNELGEMYFDFFYAKNNRYILDSTTINPQTDKQLHRWLVVPEKHLSKYSKSSLEDKNLLSVAVAQAMGMGIDKKSTESIISFGSKLLDLSKSNIKLLKENLVKGDLKEFNETTDLEVEVEHLGHFLEAIDVIEQWNQARDNEEIETSISAEYDGLTNGFAIRLMQMPIIKDVYTWLEKVGVYKLENSNTTMNNILSDKSSRFLDSYQTLADKVIKSNPQTVKESLKATNKLDINQITKILDVLPIKDINGVITKDLRDLFKNPFMVFNYASSIGSIKKSLGYVLRDKLIADMVKGKHTELVNTLGINIRELKTKYPEEIILRNGMTLDNSLREVIEVSYGNQVDDILTSYFDKYIEANDIINNTFRGMFLVFQDAYQKATKDKVLTKQEKIDEVIKLINLMPGIKGVLSKDIREGIAIYETKSLSPKDLKLGKTQTKLMQDGKEISKAVQGLIKELDMPVSAGAVIPIHSIDGSIMTELMLDMSGIVGIHDAIIPSLRESSKSIKIYNEKFYELNKNYSILDELLNQSNYTQEYMKANNINPIINLGTKKEIRLSDVISNLQNLNELNNTMRDELYSQDLSIGQMVGIDKDSLFTTGSNNQVSNSQVEKELSLFSADGNYIYSSADIAIQDDVLVRYIQDNKGAREILKYLTTNTDSFISKQAEYLLDITETFRRENNTNIAGGDVNINPIIRIDLTGVAAYNTATDTIAYSSVESMSNPLIFLHEYTHALSSKGINYMEFVIEEKGLNDMNKTNMYKAMLKDIDTVLKHKEYFNDIYAFENRHEVLAEFIANPLFRAKLKSIPNKDKQLYKRLLEAILSLFDFKRESLFDLMNRSKDDLFRVNYEVFQAYPEIRDEIDLLLTKPEGYTILDKILNKMKEC